MKDTYNDIADSKGFFVNFLSIFGKLLVFLPAVLLSGYQAIKGKYLGGWWWMLGYARDCFGNVLISPHANAKWIPENGYKFGKVEPISKCLAINLYNGTYLPPMIKYVKLTELDKNHMAKTLTAHEVPFKQERLDEILVGVMAIKQLFTMKEKVFTTIGVLAVGIPLNYHLPFSWWAIGFDIVMGTVLIFVWRK